MTQFQQENRILDFLTTAVVTLSDKLLVGLINSAAEDLLGISATRARGQSLLELIGPNPELEQAIIQANAQHQSITLRELELHRLPPQNDLLVDCTISPNNADMGLRMSSNTNAIEAGVNTLLEITRVDLLAHIRREDEMRDQHVANRQMIRGLSHEIKNPLGGLRGAAQLLDQELNNREHREYTRIITHEADRLTRLVDRLTSGHQPFDKHAVNIHSVLEYVRKLISVEVREGVEFKRDYDPSLPDISGDEQALIQVVLNIVNNAVQAVNRNGTITLRTRISRQVTIRDRRYRQVIRVDVEDNGAGVTATLKDSLFYPMVTGRADGTGLGLSIAQEIVNRHDGMIRFHSETGLTCFSIFLPLDSRL